MRTILDYWQDRAEVDFIMYELERMLQAERSLSGFARMIDQSTGYDKQKLRDAKRLIARANKLRARIEADEMLAGEPREGPVALREEHTA